MQVLKNLYHAGGAILLKDRIVTEGDILSLLGIEIEVMHFPGHSMGCTAYSFVHEQKHYSLVTLVGMVRLILIKKYIQNPCVVLPK